jgi:hypothetical protein
MASGAPFGNDPTKIERYQRFWNREPVDRPLVGFSFKSWFPLEEYAPSAAWPEDSYLTPDMVEPAAFTPDQERLLREGETLADDILRGASPSQAIPWMSGILGAKLRILPGSILGESRSEPWEALTDLALDRENPWFQKYVAFIDTLVAQADGRYPVSHGTLQGPTDMLALLRGHDQSVLDWLEAPEKTSEVLARCADIFRQVTEAAWERIPLYHGGYYDAQYQLWAPGPIARLQEDATGLYSPRLYRQYVQPIDRDLSAHFPCAFIHLHSTSMFILDDFLAVEGIRAFEVNYEIKSGGPPVEGMLPYFQRIQAADRPLLVRGSFTPDEMRLLMDGLAPEGLYLYIMVTDRDEVEALRPLVGL